MNNKSKIWLSSPHMSGNEMKYIQEAFDGNWIAPIGPNVDGFEKDLENYLGQESHVAVVSTGTAALHLALAMLGVEKDDFVICQSLTFAASANPIIYLGGIPVFVDSEKETWNLCPNAVEDAIKACINKGKKPKAIITVCLYGMPYKVEEIKEIIEEKEEKNSEISIPISSPTTSYSETTIVSTNTVIVEDEEVKESLEEVAKEVVATTQEKKFLL